MTILLLLVGLGLLILGADRLIKGASAIATALAGKTGASEFIIGFTIVGFGTSCPELVVSLTGAIQGNADIAIGNVVGSNIFNTLFILGITSLIFPVSMTVTNRKRDIPIALGVSLLLILFGMSKSIFGIGQSDSLTRAEGGFFLLAFAAYLLYSFKSGTAEPDKRGGHKTNKLPVDILFIVLGLAGLIFGSDLFVKKATELARVIGVSDKFIATTVLAGGTSIPELTTSIVAAARHKDQMALGNILGSNVFNILLVLGCSSVITPLPFSGMNPVDAAVLVFSSLLLLIWAYTGRKCHIDRWEGVIMLLSFAAYYYYLFVNL